MSEYRNFVSDFPGRCADLLSSFEKQAKLRRREVTLMLCVAAPTIIVPLERLNAPSKGPNGSDKPGHPSRDWARYAEAKSEMDELLTEDFIGSALWATGDLGTWCLDDLSEVGGDPDSWSELRTPKPLGRNKKVGTVLKHLRNALAHGNIFTRGGGEITQLLFLSKRRVEVEQLQYLAVAPADFRLFLKNWLEFLRRIDMPPDVVPESHTLWLYEPDDERPSQEAH